MMYMSQTQRLGTRSTSVRRSTDGTLTVTYHATDVVTVRPDGVIILNTGGWKTATTRTRMNQAANQFGLGYQVFQKDFRWFVRTDLECVIPFDGNTCQIGGKQ
jgi:hypothetical protein